VSYAVDGYELTERGKILIALLLVLPIFVLAAILWFSALANQPQQPPENPEQHVAIALAPTLSETPAHYGY